VSTATKPDKVRERILKTACELFYSRGINATGVDKISEAAGVSKRSLYQRFGAKDQLVAAYLNTIGSETTDSYLPAEADDESPRGRILAVFSTLRAESQEPGFRGCPLVNAAAELPDSAHPGRAVAVEYKMQVQDFFGRQAALAGARDPESLAEQLLMLFDGAMAYALVRATPIPDSTCTAAQALIESQLPHSGL
jgi:AcrR family transcriptional regulator